MKAKAAVERCRMSVAFGLMVCLGFWRCLKGPMGKQGAVQRTGDLSLCSCCCLPVLDSQDLAPDTPRCAPRSAGTAPWPGLCGFPGSGAASRARRHSPTDLHPEHPHRPTETGGAGAFPSEDAETLLLPTNTRSHPTQGNLLPLKFKLLQRGTDRQDVHRQAHQGQGREIECPKALGAMKGRTGPFL